MDIIRQAFRLMDVVMGFAGRARKLYYAVVLLGHFCPACGGKLVMVAEGRCKCKVCRNEFDPTVAFQKCSSCGGRPKLQLRRYQCGKCDCDIVSRFLFEGLVFNREYFRAKMCESRKRRKEKLDHVRKMLAECRSSPVDMQCINLSSVPGLEDALNNLTSQIAETPTWIPGESFDLKRYQGHIEAHIEDIPKLFGEIPPLSENPRKDLIWRFIAIIFLAHAGIVKIWQDGQTIMVIKNGTDTEGYGIHEDIAAVDGLEKPVGGIVALNGFSPVSPDAVKQAIETEIGRANIFQSDSTDQSSLTVTEVSSSIKGISSPSIITLTMKYELKGIDDEILFSEDITTQGRSDVFAGEPRFFKARAAAIRNNISAFVQQMREKLTVYVTEKKLRREMLEVLERDLVSTDLVYRVIDDKAVIRAFPDPRGVIVNKIERGGLVQVVGQLPTGWLQVAKEGEPIGWVHGVSLAEKVAPSPPDSQGGLQLETCARQ